MKLQPLLDLIMRSADMDLVSHAHFHPEPFLTQAHRHDHLYQLSYMVNGTSRITVGGKNHVMNVGDTLFVPPGQWHGPAPHTHGERTEIMHVKFALGQRVAWRWPTVFHVDTRLEYETLFRGMLCEFHMHRPLRESMLRSYLVQLVLTLSRSVDESSRPGPSPRRESLSIRDEHKVRMAMDWIRQHYRARVTLKDVAHAAGMSISALGHSFKTLTGVSPIHYLVQYRLSQALILMERTDDKLDAIAEAVGFSDAGYFSRVFRKRYHRAPRQYVRSLSHAR